VCMHVCVVCGVMTLTWSVYQMDAWINGFFQAEDCIRDHCVTGVQTCALPIYQRTAVRAVGGPGVEQIAERRVEVDGRREGVDRKSVVEGKSVDLGGRRII